MAATNKNAELNINAVTLPEHLVTTFMRFLVPDPITIGFIYGTYLNIL